MYPVLIPRYYVLPFYYHYPTINIILQSCNVKCYFFLAVDLESDKECNAKSVVLFSEKCVVFFSLHMTSDDSPLSDFLDADREGVVNQMSVGVKNVLTIMYLAQ